MSKTVKLRNMSAKAQIVDGSPIWLKRNEHGEEIIQELYNYKVLYSYNSAVAIYDYDNIYLLPRFDYSMTTWKHLHAFIQDHTAITDLSADDMRKAAKETHDYCYYYAEGYSCLDPTSKISVWNRY